MDLDGQDNAADQARQLVQELQTSGPIEAVAWRSNQRFSQRLTRITGPTAAAIPVDPEGTYLITGGLGGLGLQVAQWLADRGAKHLTLLSRRAPSGAAVESLQLLEQSAVQTSVLQVDVTDIEQLKTALTSISPSHPLKGVIHTAGVLDDGLLQHQTWPRFANVMAPKIEGAWHLHTLTQDLPLDFFVLFSSVVSVLGASGQGNYAAANAVLDSLAHHRRQQGLPALSLNWGPWSEVGMAATLGSAGEQQWATQGMGMITPTQGLQALADHLQASVAQVAILPMDWQRYGAQYAGLPPALIGELLAEVPTGSVTTDAESAAARSSPTPLQQQLAAVTTMQAGRSLLETFVKTEVVTVLKLPKSRPPQLQQSLFDLGIDSLMSIELRNRLAQGLGQTLSATLVFDHPTIAGLVDYLAEQILDFLEPSAQESAPATNGVPLTHEPLEQLSTDEMASLLSDKLATLNLTE